MYNYVNEHAQGPLVGGENLIHYSIDSSKQVKYNVTKGVPEIMIAILPINEHNYYNYSNHQYHWHGYLVMVVGW